MSRTLWDRFWRDKDGKVVVWQNPNLPLIIWFVCTILGYVFSAGKLNEFLEILAFGAIFTWSWLEITSGVNYFRRSLGMVVLIASLLTKL